MGFFLERRLAHLLSLRRNAWGMKVLEREAGRGREDASATGPSWQWETWPDFDRSPSFVPTIEQAAHEALVGLVFHSEGQIADLEPWVRDRAARNPGALDFQVRVARRAAVTGGESGWHLEDHAVVQIELRAHATLPGRGALMERSYPSVAALLADADRVDGLASEALRRAAARASEVPCPRGETTVVIPPGADAGVLFHELCGHPLEGDVVGRRASYLALRRGERVAPEFLTVFDDPTAGTGGMGYAVDDEGSPARPARLLRQGMVEAPLTNRETAMKLGVEANGHGRRISYRHLALPRMCHTGVAGHEGTFEELLSGVRDGVLVGFLSPRHIHLMSGEYAFDAPECWRIEDGRITEPLGPAVLRGRALETLSRIEAVGSDVETFWGLKGCGKLDQPQLPVSFANPTLRFRQLWLEPA